MSGVFYFKKQELEFYFRKPEWYDFKKELRMEYKIIGIKENSENDGYYYNSSFMPSKNAMLFPNVIINGNKITGVILPENILVEIKSLYEKSKEEYLQRRLNSDIKYVLNDMTSYGGNNGISQFDIDEILWDIIKKCNGNILVTMPEKVNEILNNDTEIKRIAIDTYQPYPENPNWNDGYLTWFREASKEKKAPGYGIIPNTIIKSKITEIVLIENEKRNKEEKEKQEKLNNIFKTAKETGKMQLIRQWFEDCNDEDEECSFDTCSEWAMPDGSTKTTRNHTW